jgi:Mg-chelatase subunit ChlD
VTLAFRRALALVVVAATCLWVPHAVGQECAAEIEPSNAPAAAAPLVAPSCLNGAIVEDDVADLFLWTVDDRQAGQRWKLALESTEGPPAVLTMSVLDPVLTEPTIVGTPIVELRPADGVAGPAMTDDLFLRAGRYLVAVAPSGPWTGASTTYRLELEPGALMPPSADGEPNDAADSASPLSGAFEVSGDGAATDDHFAWQVGEDGGSGLWTVEVQGGIGTAMSLTVSDVDGVVQGDTRSTPDGIARLPDLRLAPGTHSIRIVGTTEPTTPYILRAYREADTGADPEPNDDPAHALPVTPGELLSGRLARPGDTDAYRLTVDESLGSALIEARLIARGGSPRRLCLYRLPPGDRGPGDEVRELSCDEGPLGASLSGLFLAPGEYLLLVGGQESLLDPYYLRVDRSVEPVAGFELEPNDAPDLATPMTPDVSMRGRVDNPDIFRVHVEGDPQLWDVEARGSGVGLLWVRTDGAALGVGADPDGTAERSVLTDVYLIPGDHWFALGGSGEYELALTPLGPPVPGGEREPNSTLANANSLPMDGSITGRLGTATDLDYYRFSLDAPDHVRVTLEPPPGATLAVWPEGDTSLITSSRVARDGKAAVLDLLLPAGDHAFSVTGAANSERYRLSLERQDPFRLALDQEPNDNPVQARPIPPNLRVEGTVDEGDVGDWYRLEPLPQPGELTLRTEGAIRSLVIDDGSLQTPLTAAGDGSTYHSPPSPAGASLIVGVVADGPYAIQVEPGSTGLAAAERPAEAPIELALTPTVSEVAAFEEPGQRVAAALSLTNPGSDPLDLVLDAVTSHPDWRVELESNAVTLEPATATEVPVSIVVPSQAWADTPVRVTVRAMAGDRPATTGTEITPRAGASLVDPFRWWRLPDDLLGGLDAAAVGLGAVPLVSVDPVAETLIHDGVVSLLGGMDIVATLPLTFGVDLAGDEPVPVAGTILDPTAGPGPIAGSVRAFELLLSEDGVVYEPVLSAELTGSLAEQSFVLPEPVPARFAQLRVTSSFPGADQLRLGEWKVVASPGWQPGTASLDLVDPARGGHVVSIDPQPGGQQLLETMLSDPDGLPDFLGFDPESTDRVEWVVGFMNGRAAQVAELRWVDPPGSAPALRLESVELDGSMAGPLGPWTSLGRWALERDASGSVAPFALDAPTWVRYLRMSGRVPDPTSGIVEMPGALQVLERASMDGYRSALGEWGYATSAGPFEWQAPFEAIARSDAPDPAGSGEDVDVPLMAGQPVDGRVARGIEEDSYVFTVPPGQLVATFSVSGRPTVGVGLSLQDETGVDVPMAVTSGEVPGTIDHRATVSPGSRYRLMVDQPPFSVVVVYDTSGSVGGYIPTMTAALRTYLSGLVPGGEAVQLLDIQALPVPDEFSDDRWLILSELDAHAGSQTGSSEAEIGLIDALDLLAAREGERAILLMTDADSGAFFRHTELWHRLSLVRPRVFTVHVGGTLFPPMHRNLMQDWAAAGAGYYEHVRSGGNIGRAFDRMATWLRRPADYGLVMQLSPDAPPAPKPGSLRVVSDPNAPTEVEAARPAPEVAVELVLDTSGSMLQKLGKKRRIDVAKTVLRGLVNEDLEAGTAVALRTFRPIAQSCESELAVPLGPLDKAAMIATIDALAIPKTVRTPLAAAIAAVGADLAAVEGPRIVVVVSDGRESCDGDPEAAVQTLMDEGFDVTLNVVGLGLDKKTRRQISRLADVGQGSYYDAKDAAGLAAALRRALGAPYVVLDSSGAEVGRSSVDGPPVELSPGSYSIALVGAPSSFDVVTIESGEDETVVSR